MKREKAVLFTNIEYVTVNGVRMMCNALLLESVEIFDGRMTKQARGFGMDSTWPVFEVKLATIECSIDVTDRLEDDIPRTYDIKAGDVTFGVVTCNADHPIEVEMFEKFDYAMLWEALEKRTNKYWWAPGMPKLTWIDNPHPRKYDK